MSEIQIKKLCSCVRCGKTPVQKMAVMWIYGGVFVSIIFFEYYKRSKAVKLAKKKDVNHSLSLLIQIQTLIQAPLKPAQWIPFIRDQHRYAMNIGTFNISNPDNFEDLVALACEKSGLIAQYPVNKVNNNKYTIDAYYYTPKNAWLDIVTLTVDRNENEVSIEGIGESTGTFPLTIPFAPFLNILFCWFPFKDHGNNKRYLRHIQKNITAILTQQKEN